jgi:hypothetical protein
MLAAFGGFVGPAAAGEFELRKYYVVENADHPVKEPAFRSRIEGQAWSLYSGLKAAAVPMPDHDTEFELYVGLRPRALGVDWDLKYNRAFTDQSAACCGVFALNFDRELGPAATLRGVVAVNPGSETARTETRATLEVFDSFKVESLMKASISGEDPAADGYVYVDVGASRSFEHSDKERTSVAFRVADTNRAAPSARVTVDYIRRF